MLLFQILFRVHHAVKPNWLNCVILRVPSCLVAPVKTKKHRMRILSLESGFTSTQAHLWPSNPASCFLLPAYTHFIGLHHCFHPAGCVRYFWREKRLCSPSQAPCVSQTGRKIAGESSGSFSGSCLSQWTHLFPFMSGDFSLLLIPLFFLHISNKQIAPLAVWHEEIIICFVQG